MIEAATVGTEAATLYDPGVGHRRAGAEPLRRPRGDAAAAGALPIDLTDMDLLWTSYHLSLSLSLSPCPCLCPQTQPQPQPLPPTRREITGHRAVQLERDLYAYAMQRCVIGLGYGLGQGLGLGYVMHRCVHLLEP